MDSPNFNAGKGAVFTHASTKLAEMRMSDIPSLVKYLNDQVIYTYTLSIPYPYTQADAEKHLHRVFEFEKKNKVHKDWAIRSNDELIGSLGLLWNYGLDTNKSEIGYWLAAPFRGKGIMSECVRIWSDFILNQARLVRLEANVYPENIAFCRVLEKAGFKKEGFMIKAFKKEDRYLDAWMFGKTRA